MRVVNRPLAFILAAALAVAAVLVIVEVIGVAVNHGGPLVVPWTTWYRWASRTRWNQLVIQFWSAILIAIGVVVLALELKPPRVTRMSLRSRHDATHAAVTRRGLANTLRSAATGIDGVSAAAVTVGRRRARVTATAAARGRTAAEALRQPVTQALQGRLDAMGLRHPPSLTVCVNTRSS
jgi:Ni/Fe-hydrogenase subunit HybB-like protein